MKKLLLLVVAAICATTMKAGYEPWAYYSWRQVDSPPYTQWLTGLTYNSETQTLSFKDEFRNNLELYRGYNIEVYKRGEGFGMTRLWNTGDEDLNNDEAKYIDYMTRNPFNEYGYLRDDYAWYYIPMLKQFAGEGKLGETYYEVLIGWRHKTFYTKSSNNFMVCKDEAHGNFSGKGGSTDIDIHDIISKAREKGVTSVRLFVWGKYLDPVNYEWNTYFSTEEPLHRKKTGGYLTSWVDIDIPAVEVQEIRQQGGPEGPVSSINAWYEQTVDATVDIHSSLPVTCRWQVRYHKDGGQGWRYAPFRYTNSEGETYEKWNEYFTAKEARRGQTLYYHHPISGNGYRSYMLRLEVQPENSLNKYYSNEVEVNVLYPWYNEYGGLMGYQENGSKLTIEKAPDGYEYRFVSDLPVHAWENEENPDYIDVVMPAAPLGIERYQPTYQVDFYDADATLLKSEEVKAGDDATPPDMGNSVPALAGQRKAPSGSFKGWDKDYTNVHQRLNVFAKRDLYVDMDIDMVGHTCDRTDDWKFASWFGTKFEGNKQKAMLGDQLTFRASVKTNTPVNVYFQTGTVLSNGDISWNTATKVGEVTGYEMNKTMTFDKEVTALVDYYNEMPFERKRFYRFYAVGAATEDMVYSSAMEVEMFYPLTVVADQEVQVLTHESGFFFNGTRSVIPVKYGERVLILDQQGFKGAGLDLARVNKPGKGYLTDGTDENGNRYFEAPGERETLNVTTRQMTVVFEVPGQGKPEFKKYGNSAYDVQTVPYGHGATLPEQPTEENSLFLGWQSWNPDEYLDDGYEHVTQDLIGFTAQFEYIPPVPTYTVTFKDYDGTVLSTQTVEEGQNAEAPTVNGRTGYHFTGWDKAYSTVTGDLTVTALYGKDEVYYTITYKDYDGTDLGSEDVLEGEAATRLSPTREHYTFSHWRDYWTGDEVDLSQVTADMTVEAVYTETLWTLTFRVEGVVKYTIQVVDGHNPHTVYYPLDTPTKESTASTDYTFTGWTPDDVTSMTEDLVLDAQFAASPRKYNVTFQNWDHTLLETQAVAYGKAAQAPADPTKAGYTFTGWDRNFSDIRADMTVTAEFIRNDLMDAIREVLADEGYSAETIARARKVVTKDGILVRTPDGKEFRLTGVEVK